MSLKDRILAIIDYYKLNPNKFSEQIGMSRAFVKNINDEISTKPLRNILLMFPDINCNWLILGEGEMLNSKKEKFHNEIAIPPDPVSPELLLEYLREKDEKIEKLSKEIGALKCELELAYQRKRGYPLVTDNRNVAEKPINYNSSETNNTEKKSDE